MRPQTTPQPTPQPAARPIAQPIRAAPEPEPEVAGAEAEGEAGEIPCPACGTMISSDAIMCYACGHRLAAEEDDKSAKKGAGAPKKVLKKKVI